MEAINLDIKNPKATPLIFAKVYAMIKDNPHIFPGFTIECKS